MDLLPTIIIIVQLTWSSSCELYVSPATISSINKTELSDNKKEFLNCCNIISLYEENTITAIT